ncbi:MAG: hypothetical protein KAY24_00210 [Candidatus Eisenbacteria sp.]|nr:hypothetical protein [Candidatus Eisenbacteria bacterium]
MSKPLVYIAGPIQAIGKFPAMVRNAKLAYELSRLGIASFDPAAAFKVPEDGTASAVEEVNKAAIRRCDVFVAFWQGVQSPGTDREVTMALEGNLPIIVIQLPPGREGLWESEWDHTIAAEWLEGRFPNPTDWLVLREVVGDIRSAAVAASKIIEEGEVG